MAVVSGGGTTQRISGPRQLCGTARAKAHAHGLAACHMSTGTGHNSTAGQKAGSGRACALTQPLAPRQHLMLVVGCHQKHM